MAFRDGRDGRALVIDHMVVIRLMTGVFRLLHDHLERVQDAISREDLT